MEPLYAVDSFNYPDGYPLALLAATVGMFLGVICGAVLVNLAPLAGKAPDASGGGGTGSVPYSTSQRLRLRLRKMGAAVAALKATAPESDHYGPRERPAAATQTVSAESLDSLMFHVCLVLCVMCVGYVLRLPVVAIEEVFPKGSFLQKSNLLSVLPLFLFCLLGGLAVQKCVDRTRSTFIDRETIVRISNTAQDVLIVAAISRLGRNGLPPGVHGLGNFFRVVFESGALFILVCVGGIAWGVVSSGTLRRGCCPITGRSAGSSSSACRSARRRRGCCCGWPTPTARRRCCATSRSSRSSTSSSPAAASSTC